MISEQSKQEIYSKINIVEVIEDFITLKRKGKDYQALCPFHNEKTPSFSVSPSKNIFKCFGCQKGGDAITFLLESQGYSYPEALQYLARKYHVTLQYDRQKSEDYDREQKLKEGLLIVLNFAKNYYKQLLKTDPQNSIGLNYFSKRGLKPEIIESFELGYSQNNPTAFLKYARQNQHNTELLEQAGLIRTKDNRTYDYFRGRVIFPIKNHLGKVVGFGARSLKQGDKVKYLNSPETLVYRKNQVLYGLYEAKSEIQKQDKLLLVEGYLDVLMLYQAGIKNVVASAGTALTQDQVLLLKRHTKNLILLYDGDSAGHKATLRAIEIILAEDLQVEIIPLPEGQDPDSYIQELGKSAFEEHLQTAKTGFIPFILKDFDMSKPISKKKAVETLVKVISLIPNAIGRRIFFEEAARAVDLEVEFLLAESNKLKSRSTKQTGFQNDVSFPVPPPPLDHYNDYAAISDLDYESPTETIPKTPDFDRARYAHEHEFLRILLLHGHKIISPVEDDCLADYLLAKIKAIPFSDPFALQILELYEAESKANLVDLKTFQNTCAEKKLPSLEPLFNEDYKPSKNWARFSRVPKPYDHNLEQIIATNLTKLKYYYLDSRYQALATKITEPDSEKLHELEQIGEERRALGKALKFMF